jgi:repressor LexA
MIHVIPIGAGAAFQRPIAGTDYRDGTVYAPSVAADSRKPGDGQLCTVFTVDVVGFTRADRNDDIRRYLHERLYAYLEKAFDDSGVPWAECFIEDRGDGALIVIPPGTPADGLIGQLPENLRGLVRMHNRRSAEAAGMQLRAAVHIGPVEHDRHGFVGSDINLLFRMLEARPLKHALAGSGAELALMVSEDVYRSLVCRCPSLVSPDAFRRVRFQVKQTRGRAWIYLPGLSRLADEVTKDTECDIDQVMAAFKTALAHMDYSAREAARIRNLATVTDAQEAAEEESRTPATPTGRTLSQARETAAAPLAASVTRLAEPSDVLRRAGHPFGAATLKKGTRVTGIDRSKLATALGKRYDSGESIRSLAASTGRSYGFVHRILTETGVTLRGGASLKDRPEGRPGRKPEGGVPVVVPETPDKPDPDHVLTWRQRKVLQVIRESVQQRGYPPSMREIGEAVGLTSTSSVAYQLSILQKKGYLHRDVGRSRTAEVRLPGHPAVRPEPSREPARPEEEASDIPGIDIPSQEAAYVPLVGRIAAGGPILAEQAVEDVFPLPRQLVGEGTLFLLKVAGDSMMNAAITDGDWVVVQQREDAEDGEIVAAMLDGEATIKTFKRSDGHVWLIPHNPAYTPILGDEAVILGRVVAVLRRI